MTISEPSAVAETASAARRGTPWYVPTFSPEHGVYVMLIVAFLTGAAAAQHWSWRTTLALVTAFSAFQAEHPLTLQIKQRRSWKPRCLMWGGVYSALALGIAFYLYLEVPRLLWIYLGAIAIFVIDSIAVVYRQRKAIWNELLTFAGVCLVAPLTEMATTEEVSFLSVGLWLLNTLFFGSAIFAVKLRKHKTAFWLPGLIYHSVAALLIGLLWWLGWLPPLAAAAFAIALLKFGLIVWQANWYRNTAIKNVALLETGSAFLFLSLILAALLPAHLPRP
ncbi:YwiC-like family protein [Thermosynechococcus sp. GLH187]|uniref:YwiC-like family protein n=1 Tax=unclassified Thermosynechococcus TaxID=2622553 RepID=UPI00197CBA73|nr:MULTISPECIES: YwiC-like family protein [unclassified Thermosynechococcus]QSF49727.1 YwiC-like family protein [Thermosynechococcus sp. TA-1]WNC45670.1 YwiC-like family protein [Thermosynechococcus sp. GLH187]WNC48206.1 YwiC-like family protein [Thermosynechococcus sp. GLH333]WNC50739.1 YwiC-like family protein [Thermosynechococcus sp. GLH87]